MQNKLSPIDQSKNTEIPASSPAKIGTEIFDQSIPSMLRLIVDYLAFTL
jgi:hypothetical protein